jgi:single-stranded DNA-binding protein
MKKGINEVSLLGRCGEIQFASSAKGLNYAKFSVAVSNEWIDGNGEKKTKTEWIPVSCRDSAPNTGIGTVAKKYLKKGMLVCVKGRFETTSKDGNTYVVVVVDADPATSLFFYETQSPQAQQQPQQPQQAQQAQQQGYQPAPQPQQQAPQVQQQGYQPAPQPQQQAPQVQQQGYQPAPQPQQQAPQAQQQSYQPAPQPQQQAPQVQQQNGPLPPMPSFPNGNLISDDDIPF